jgi:signal transduction histidine kinase
VRLERSFEQLRRFTSDASHALRTPLTSIRSVGELALQKDGTREEYRDTIGSMLEEVNRLTVLIDTPAWGPAVDCPFRGRLLYRAVPLW